MTRTDIRASWPKSARFSYGDPVRLIVKREGQPRWFGYVVGYYRPTDGRHCGYAVEHDIDGAIHVYPESALEGGVR